jgi:hypothetical protein
MKQEEEKSFGGTGSPLGRAVRGPLWGTGSPLGRSRRGSPGDRRPAAKRRREGLVCAGGYREAYEHHGLHLVGFGCAASTPICSSSSLRSGCGMAPASGPSTLSTFARPYRFGALTQGGIGRSLLSVLQDEVGQHLFVAIVCDQSQGDWMAQEMVRSFPGCPALLVGSKALFGRGHMRPQLLFIICLL